MTKFNELDKNHPLPQPQYSPYFAPSDYLPPSNLKKCLCVSNHRIITQTNVNSDEVYGFRRRRFKEIKLICRLLIVVLFSYKTSKVKKVLLLKVMNFTCLLFSRITTWWIGNWTLVNREESCSSQYAIYSINGHRQKWATQEITLWVFAFSNLWCRVPEES